MENGPEENDKSEQEFEEPGKTITHSEAESMLSKCFEWFVQQTEADATQLLLL